MARHVEFEQWVPFPVERVFAFFSNPENLPRIMPDASATRLVAVNRVSPEGKQTVVDGDKAAGTGSVLVTSFRIFPLLPLRARWIARITEFEWSHHFADVQEKGPFKLWNHRHEFESAVRQNVAGTMIRDVIEYAVGLGFVGRVADALFVRRQMDRTFRERQRKLPDLLRG